MFVILYYITLRYVMLLYKSIMLVIDKEGLNGKDRFVSKETPQ